MKSRLRFSRAPNGVKLSLLVALLCLGLLSACAMMNRADRWNVPDGWATARATLINYTTPTRTPSVVEGPGMTASEQNEPPMATPTPQGSGAKITPAGSRSPTVTESMPQTTPTQTLTVPAVLTLPTATAAAATVEPSLTPAPSATRNPSAPQGAVPVVAPSIASPVVSRSGPDLQLLAQRMLGLVNRNRQAAGLMPVEWDPIAAQAGQAHTEEMIRYGYFSHWDMSGGGPDWRYTRLGGGDSVMENIYLYEHSAGGGPANAQAWDDLIQSAEANLMNSPGHRANILTPEHTHLGVGIAYDAAAGRVRIAQEFVNRYVSHTPLPRQGQLGQAVEVQGELSPQAGQPLLNLAYEPLPVPLTVQALNATGTYASPALFCNAISVKPLDDRTFHGSVTLDCDKQPGLYHIRLWVKTKHGDTLAMDHVVEVSE